MRAARARGRYAPQKTSFGWIALFAGPALALYTVLVIVPIFTAFVYGMFRWEGTASAGFAGFGNYVDLFTRYPESVQLWAALGHNLLFFIGTMLVQNTVGLGLALLLHRTRVGKRLFQTLYSIPYLISPLIVGYLWSLLLSPNFGPVNAALTGLGLGDLALPWLGQPETALPALIMINAWQWIGGPLLIFGAALGGVPQELEEAAALDGASSARVFWSVRFPLIMPAIGVITVLTFIGTFNIFDLVFALGGPTGGPSGAMDVLGMLYYRLAFNGGTNAIGESSAFAILTFILIFGVAIMLERVMRRREVSA